ncbi:hypothetical protein GCM10017559_71100 [Streptosporangium longisporum]|uniref:Uncharacterized protein n=1 Tax=Streptosporangium longisporum TaxID=46187 RepID=A0ABP6LAX3_9ACTN
MWDEGETPDTGRDDDGDDGADDQADVSSREPPFMSMDLLTFPDDGNRYELFNGSLL